MLIGVTMGSLGYVMKIAEEHLIEWTLHMTKVHADEEESAFTKPVG